MKIGGCVWFSVGKELSALRLTVSVSTPKASGVINDGLLIWSTRSVHASVAGFEEGCGQQSRHVEGGTRAGPAGGCCWARGEGVSSWWTLRWGSRQSSGPSFPFFFVFFCNRDNVCNVKTRVWQFVCVLTAAVGEDRVGLAILHLPV